MESAATSSSAVPEETKKVTTNGNNKSTTCRQRGSNGSKGKPVDAFVSLADRTGKLSKVEVECSICWNVLIEPVTIPCRHSFCKKCFGTHLDISSLYCPKCRLRVSIWMRNATKNNTLVDERLWARIQSEFPDLVKVRLAEIKVEESSQPKESVALSVPEENEEEEPFVRDGEFNLTPGHILAELQQILEPHKKDLLTQREKEEAASFNLAKQLQEEEERERRILEEQKMEDDRKFAERLQKELDLEYAKEQERINLMKMKASQPQPAQVFPAKPANRPEKPSRKRKRKLETVTEASEDRENSTKIQSKITSFAMSPSQSSGDSGVASSIASAKDSSISSGSVITSPVPFVTLAASTSSNKLISGACLSLVKNEQMTFSDDEDESSPTISEKVTSALAALEKDCTLNKESQALPNIYVEEVKIPETNDDVVIIAEIKKTDPPPSKEKEAPTLPQVSGTPPTANSARIQVVLNNRGVSSRVVEPLLSPAKANTSDGTTSEGKGLQPVFTTPGEELPNQTLTASQGSNEEMLNSPSILFMEKSDGSANQTVVENRVDPEESPGPSPKTSVGNENVAASQLESSTHSVASAIEDSDEEDLDYIPDSLPSSPCGSHNSEAEGAEFINSFLEYKAEEERLKREEQEEADRALAKKIQRRLNKGLQERGKADPGAYSLRSWTKDKK